MLSIQLLIPPYIGLANNGDFGKVCARFSLAPKGGWGDAFIYFAPDYEYAPANYWKSDVVTSEIALAAAPAMLGGIGFNIRRLGVLHALLFLAGFCGLIVYLRRFGRMVQVAVGLFALWTFGDVVYVAYFNSFYSDTAAILGILLTVVLALHLTRQDRPRLATLALFTFSALLFITSKGQHGIFGFIPALFAMWKRA